MAIQTPRARFSRPFDRDRLAALLKVADDLERTMDLPGGEITETQFFRALFLAQYDTGFSIRQLLALEWRAIRPTGEIPLEFRLSKESLLAIGRIVSPHRPQVFALPDGMDFGCRLSMIRRFSSWEKGGAE